MTPGRRDGRPSPCSRPALVLSLVVVSVATLLTACGSSAPGGPPTTAQITALLIRHARAVLTHDTAAFLADVDRDRTARPFRDRQSAQLAALQDVPLQSWAYAIAAPVSQPDAVAAARARYGAPAAIVRLALSYRLAGVDPAPSTHDLWWTFVRRGGRTLVAGDDDLADSGGRSWRGPWDFGPLQVRRVASGLVLVHPGTTTRLPDLAVALDAAVPSVTRVWGAGWARQVAVVVPGSAAELAELSGTAGGVALDDVAAVTIADPPDPLSGRVTGQRVLMNPQTLAVLTPSGLRIVLQHESTHVATGSATAPDTPRWVVEGFADYVGNLDSGQSVRTSARELAAEVATGRLPTALPPDDAFLRSPGDLAAVYEEAWLACRLIAERAGVAGLVRFYRAVGTAESDAAGSVAAALHAVMRTTPAAFLAQWRDYLRTELA